MTRTQVRTTVLVADQDRRVRAALAGLLDAVSGFAVVAATGTAAATLAAAQDLGPDVALVDLLLPDVDSGLDLVRQLSGIQGLRVLALSAQGHLRAAALAAGATDFVDKGTNPEALLAAVRPSVAGTEVADDRPALLSGDLTYPESPRWHDGKLWLSDVHAYAVKTVDASGRVEHVVDVPGRPAGLGFLPDGRLLIASALDRKLWTYDGTTLGLAADLSPITRGLLNDMVVDQQGRAYVGDTGFDLMAGDEPRPGQIILYSEGGARVVDRDVMFPNGAATDGRRYWVAETVAQRVSVFDVTPAGDLAGRRTLVELPDLPDGLCLDVEGAVWVALLRRGEFWRVLADGTVSAKVSAEGRLAVACTLGGPDRRTLYLCSAATTMAELALGRSTGLVHTLAAVPGAGRP
ncbi:SMP-30/gluconolactonase/LRE family protein [Kribbella sp. CA-253562]|uniref:SMP-30/gluconolactonase/LRE family protein n=1 Tax=Kribbella sp. CA-253562 TaxID=3239942 RepID=UPI003D921281